MFLYPVNNLEGKIVVNKRLLRNRCLHFLLRARMHEHADINTFQIILSRSMGNGGDFSLVP